MADKTSVFGSAADDKNRGASSLGNQEKFQRNGKFFKLDYLGYEGLSEVISSRLATHTTLTQYGVTEYFPFCDKNTGCKSGCYSMLFGSDECRELTLYKILTACYNTNLEGVYRIYEDTYDTLTLSFFDFVRETIYGLFDYDILPWITQLLKFDWLVLNEDRHFRNISFLLAGNKLSPAPLFDNGAALLSDLASYPREDSIEGCVLRVAAKPFNSSFKVQVQAIEAYDRPKLQFLESHIDLNVSDLTEFYPKNLILRAQSVLQINVINLK